VAGFSKHGNAQQYTKLKIIQEPAPFSQESAYFFLQIRAKKTMNQTKINLKIQAPWRPGALYLSTLGNAYSGSIKVKEFFGVYCLLG
jgi:hypothetical protein